MHANAMIWKERVNSTEKDSSLCLRLVQVATIDSRWQKESCTDSTPKSPFEVARPNENGTFIWITSDSMPS